MTVYALNGGLHGPIHIMVGGHWGLGAKWEDLISSTISKYASEILLGQK